jgi:hypothetical protein
VEPGATVAVRQLPQAPTYFVGTVVAPTAGLPIHRDSTMSTYGTLKYRRATFTMQSGRGCAGSPYGN